MLAPFLWSSSVVNLTLPFLGLPTAERENDELAEYGLSAREVIGGIVDAVVVEEYPNYPKGPSVLLLRKDKSGSPVHVVWGILKGYNKPGVLLTAYRPDSERWDENFIKRR